MKTGYDQFFTKAKQTSKANPSASKKSPIQRQKRSKRSSFPTKSLFIFALIAGMGLLAVENFDEIETQLKRIEIGVGLAHAEDKPIAKAAAAPIDAATPAVAGSLDNKAISIDKPVDESDYLFKLADRKKQLDEREEELNKVAAEIAKQKVEIEEKLQKLEETRQKISTALEEKIKADDGKVETLVQMYSNMKPQQAAKVFETLDEDLVIEILGRMKKKNAADILNLIKAEKAQIFAERYVGYRVPASK